MKRKYEYNMNTNIIHCVSCHGALSIFFLEYRDAFLIVWNLINHLKNYDKRTIISCKKILQNITKSQHVQTVFGLLGKNHRYTSQSILFLTVLRNIIPMKFEIDRTIEFCYRRIDQPCI